MKPVVVSHYLGFLLLLLAACMGLVIPVAFALNEPGSALHMGISATITGASGALLFLLSKGSKGAGVSRRDAFAIVTFAWLLTGLFGSLPYLVSHSITSPVDALFESFSGFTTTGASIVPRPASLPRTILLWRALTQWLGGMGIIVLFVAVFSELGVGARFLFESEVPGPITDTMRPRIRDTSLALWRVYLVLTLAQTLVLVVCGLDLYDAVCHAFSTVSTGGFSTRNESLAAFSPLAQTAVMIFMVLAGANFSLYLAVFAGRPSLLLRDRELWFYLSILILCGLIMAASLHLRFPDGLAALRHGLFQVISIATTTGFTTDNFDEYQGISKLILLMLMVVGGCAGSTAGGMKVIRLLILFKVLHRGVIRMLRPQIVMPIRLGPVVLSEAAVEATSGFFFLYVVTFVFASVFVAAHGLGVATAVSSVAASLGNVGPGLEAVGPASHYGHLPYSVKLVLIGCMVMGRLEFYTVLALFVPSFWKR